MAETLRFDVVGRGDASDLERLAAAVDRFADRLKALDRTDARPEIDVDTRRAERKVGAFAENLKRRIGRAIDSLPDIELDADSSDAERAVAAIRTELASLSDKEIGVDIDTEEARRQVVELEQRLREISDVDVDVSLRADVAAALAELRRATGEVDKLDGRTAKVKVEVDRGLGDAIVQVAALGRALSLLTIPAAAVAAAPTIAAIGAAAVTAAGAVGVLPATLLEAGAAAATLAVGLHGVGDALGALDDAKKFAEALKELSPNAREFATAVRDIAPAWRSVRLDTQQALFAGLGAEMQKLSSAYLPSMRSGLGGVASELNLLAKDFVGFATGARTVENVDAIFRNTKATMQALRPVAQNLAGAFLDIGVVGSELLPGLASSLTDATARFRTFIDQARQSGQLKQWMQAGIDTVEQLGSIVVNVGSTLLSVFNAQKAAGSELLTTLDRLTEGMARWTASAEGQRVLVSIFQEIRSTIDAVQPGLAALAQSALQAVAAFANTGALTAAGQAFSAIAQAVAPLLPVLAELAGGVVNTLATAFSAAAAAIGPIVSALSGLLTALDPIPAAAIAMVLAFKGLSVAVAAISGLGVALAGMVTKARGAQTATSTLGATIAQIEGKAAAGERSTSRLARAFSGLGTAIPIAGAALVGIIALYGQAASKADESAKAIINGSMSMQQAIQTEVGQLENRNAAYRAANIEGQEFASVTQNAGAASRGLQTEHSKLAESTTAVSQAVQEAYNKLSPYEKLQADVAMAERELNDALASNNMAAAAAATDKLSAAKAKLAAVDKTAADSAKTYEERLVESVDSMRNHIAASLQLEQSSARVTEAQKSANEALKQYGADSSQYQAEVLNLAQAHLAQADAARQVGEQLGGAAGGAAAWNTELLKIDRSTTAGAAAFAQIAQGMTDSERAAFSAAAAASGLRTEIITLPNGKQIRVVVDADRSKLDSTKAALDQMVKARYTGTVTILGDPTPFKDGFYQAVRLADGTTATLKLNADKSPAEITVNGLRYAIDATTGTLKVLSDVSPGTATLDGFKYVVDSTTGEVKILAADGSARTTTEALVGFIGGQTGTVNIDGDPALVNGKTQYAVTSINGQKGTITIDGEPDPATGAVDATITYADGKTAKIKFTPETGEVTTAIGTMTQPTTSEHTITVNDSAVTTAKSNATNPTSSTHTINVTNNVPAAVTTNTAATSSTHTINVNAEPTTTAIANAKLATESLHTIKCDDKAVLDAKRNAEQATSSLHTINCDDSAVRDAKANAQKSTSSTHTIHVVVVGAAPPRAAGAYTTPRAEGAYAAPMAQGGMRRMSAARAEIVPPRQPRIIGDRMEGDEAFIPINRSARSRSILKTAANRMGYEVTPIGGNQPTPDGMLSSIRSSVSQRPATPGGGLKAALQELNTTLRDLEHGRQGATVNNNFYTDLREVADDVARNARRQHALGLFG